MASPVPCLRRQPTSYKNEKVSGPKGPDVSIATCTGVKVWLWSRAEYVSCLFRSARAATAPAFLTALGRWEGTNVSRQVVSHTRSLPFPQGTSMTPLGHLPLEWKRPVGSSLDGKWAADIAWLTMSLMAHAIVDAPHSICSLGRGCQCLQVAHCSGDRCGGGKGVVLGD